MKYIKFLIASAIIMCSGIMSNSAYCADNNVQINMTLLNHVDGILGNMFHGNHIVNSIPYRCWFVAYSVHCLSNFYIDCICKNVQFNINDINRLFGLNINNANGIITYDEFINHLQNRLNTIINDTMQLINNHIDQIQNNNVLRRNIIQEIGNLYNSVMNITNNFFELMKINLNANKLTAFNNHECVIKLQDSIHKLNNVIRNNSELEFGIIEYPKLVKRLEELFNNIPHDGTGDIIFNNQFLKTDMSHKIVDFARSFERNLCAPFKLENSLRRLADIVNYFPSHLDVLKGVLDDYNDMDFNKLLNKQINYDTLSQQTNGIFILNGSAQKDITFIQAITYFSNRVEIQLLQIIRDIMSDLKYSNYLDTNAVQNIINNNIHQNIDRIRQIMNALVQFIQNNNELNSNDLVIKHVLPYFQKPIDELNNFNI